MDVLAWLGGPFLLGALLAALFLSGGARWYLLLGLGLLFGLGFVAYVYLSSPIDFQHDPNGCSDCEQYLGRWWEPNFVAFLVALGYLAWVVGLGIGIWLRTLLLRARKPDAI